MTEGLAELVDAALAGQPEAVLRVSQQLIGRGFKKEAATLRQMTGVTGGRLPMPRTALDAMRETGVRPIPVVGAVVDAASAARLWSASRRLEVGEATPEDEKLVLGYLAEEERNEKRGATVGYYAMLIGTGLTAFAGEVAGTGGIFTAGKIAARKAARKGVGAAVRQSIERVAGRTAASLAVRATGVTAGAALQASANVPRIVGATLSRAMPTWSTTEDEAGEAALVLVESGKSFVQALPAGWADTLIEYVSERAGAGITQVPGISRLVALQGRVLEKLAGGSKGKLGDLLAQVGSSAGWHGVIGEMGEERFAAVLRAVVLDDPWSEVFPSGEQLAGEAIAFSVPGAGAAAISRLGSRKAGAAAKTGEGEPVAVGTDETAPATLAQEGAATAPADSPVGQPSQVLSPPAAPSPPPAKIMRQFTEANRGAMRDKGLNVQVVQPERPGEVWATEAGRAFGQNLVLVDAGKPLRFPAAYDERTILLDRRLETPELIGRVLAHEVNHALKGTEPGTYADAWAKNRAMDAEGVAQAEADYAANYAASKGEPLTPERLKEEGESYYVELRANYIWDAIQNPQRIEALSATPEGRSWLSGLIEKFKAVIARLTGGKIRSLSADLEAWQKEVARSPQEKAMSPEDALRFASTMRAAFQALSTLPPIEAQQASAQAVSKEAPKSSEAPKGSTNPDPRLPRGRPVQGPPVKQPSSKPESKPEPAKKRKGPPMSKRLRAKAIERGSFREFVRVLGGVKGNTPEGREMYGRWGGENDPGGGFGLGPLVRSPKGKGGGLEVDYLLEAAVQEGFFEGRTTGELDFRDFSDAIEIDLKRPQDYSDEADRMNAAEERRLNEQYEAQMEDYVPDESDPTFRVFDEDPPFAVRRMSKRERAAYAMIDAAEAGDVAAFRQAMAERLADEGKEGDIRFAVRPAWEDEFTDAGHKINADGTVTLYHGTTAERADKMVRDGVMRSAEGASEDYGVHFSTDPAIGEHYGDGTVVEVRVRASDLRLEDAFPSGRMDFAAKTKGLVYRPASMRRANPDIRFAVQPDPMGFYSKMEQTLEDKIQGKRATVPQVRALLKDVKDEEVQWSGIEDFLKGKQAVSKEALLQFVRENNVRVEEVTLGADRLPSLNGLADLVKAQGDPEAAILIRRLESWEAANPTLRGGMNHNRVNQLNAARQPDSRYPLPPGDPGNFMPFEAVDRARNALGGLKEMRSAEPKHGQYQLPGGENYRELLLTLPSRRAPYVYPEPLTELPEGYDIILDRQAPSHEQWGVTPPGQTHARFWEGAHATQEEAVAAALRLINSRARQAAKTDQDIATPDFTGGHYGETPNVLAHVRFNERTDSEGARVLFLEEIQSDWHQEGRKKGYGSAPRWVVYEVRDASEQKLIRGQFDNARNAEQEADRLQGENESEDTHYTVRREDWQQGVPDAPFKTSWHELALKRMVRWAAEHGFDKLAWTTGAQQVERYETALRQVADSHSWGPEQGRKRVHFTKDGRETLSLSLDERGVVTGTRSDGGAAGELAGKTLEDVVGKEAAQRILDAESGEGGPLTIGGKGMEGFYDRMLPLAANKIGKRFGARVERAEIGTVEAFEGPGQTDDFGNPLSLGMQRATVHALPITPDMRATVVEQGFPRFAVLQGDVEIASVEADKPAAVSSARAWLRRNLASRGNLPESTFKALIERDARVAVAMQGIRYGIRDFRRAARKLYGSKVPYELLDQALKDPEALASLPEGIRGPLQAMRSDIDAFSRAMIDSGAVEGALIARIQDNIGFYATRSYRAFDDPKWAEKVPAEVRNKAKAMLRAEYLGRAAKARERAQESAGARAEALEAVAQRMEERASEERLEGLIGSMLYEGKAAQTMIGLLSSSKLGSKDISILRRRKDIAPEIRALFGEYLDPTVNYARSVTKMGHLIANHRFLASVRESGLGEGFLSEAPTGRNVARIAADESDVMYPLNGLYTTVEVEQAFRDLNREQMPEWLRFYLRINGAVKYAKTVGSVVTQVRNFTGNLGFVLANGHYRVGKTAGAFRAVLTRFAGDDKAWRDRYQDALRHGVIHESANAGELRDVLQDAMRRDIDSVLLTQANPIQKGIGLLTDIYSSNDDFWKLYAWQNEMDSYRVAHPEWSEERLKRETAEIVRNTFPTYSLVPRLVKKLRRFPLVGSFVSFPSEVVRTAKNTIGQAVKELGDERTKAIGARRVAGMVLAATSTAAAAAASRFLMGMSGDDDDDARQFVPPWSKNSDLVWVGRGKGKNPLYVDVSYTDPYSYLKAPLKAFLRGEGWQEKVVSALGEATEPWIGEEILAGGILDVLRNKKSRGGEVYNEGADPTTQAQEIAGHLWQSLQPGTVGSIQRIHRGLTGRVTPYGRAYDPKIEALATMTGVRLTELDVAQSLRFRASDFQRQMSNATRMVSSVTRRAGEVSEGEIARAYSSLEASRRRHFSDMRRAVEAAQALGLSRQEIVRELRESLSAENVGLLLRNRYMPYKPSGIRNERDRQVARLYRDRVKEIR